MIKRGRTGEAPATPWASSSALPADEDRLRPSLRGGVDMDAELERLAGGLRGARRRGSAFFRRERVGSDGRGQAGGATRMIYGGERLFSENGGCGGMRRELNWCVTSDWSGFRMSSRLYL